MEKNPYNSITEPASWKWFNEKPKDDRVKPSNQSPELTQLKAENERLKNQLKLFVDAMTAMADTTFIVNH
jgi:hypothetical protein